MWIRAQHRSHFILWSSWILNLYEKGISHMNVFLLSGIMLSEPLQIAFPMHYNDVIMSAMSSQITSLTIVYSTVQSGLDQRKHQSSASLAFVRGIHRWPVNSLHKWPVTWKMFPFDDVIVRRAGLMRSQQDSDRWWSVSFTCAWLYMSFLLFCLICVYSSQFSISFWIMNLL